MEAQLRSVIKLGAEWEVSGQLPAPAALTPGKPPPVGTE